MPPGISTATHPDHAWSGGQNLHAQNRLRNEVVADQAYVAGGRFAEQEKERRARDERKAGQMEFRENWIAPSMEGEEGWT